MNEDSSCLLHELKGKVCWEVNASAPQQGMVTSRAAKTVLPRDQPAPKYFQTGGIAQNVNVAFGLHE